MGFYHSETVAYIVVGLIVQYQHKIYFCVYPSHIKMQNIWINHNVKQYRYSNGFRDKLSFSYASSLDLHDVNGEESKLNNMGEDIYLEAF